MTVREAKHPAARHLVHEEERILACVHCGFCLSACPTYTRLGDEADSPRGRIYLMRAVAEGRIEPDDDAFVEHIGRCLGCRACEPVCPSGVEYGRLVEHARNAIAEATGSSLFGRALLFVFGNRITAALAGAGGRVLRSAGIAARLARAIPARFRSLRFSLAMLAATRPMDLRRVRRANPNTLDSGAAPRDGGARTAVLRGCVQGELFARVNHATAAVLAENGCIVIDTPGQGCCGALHAHGGDLDQARKLARHNIAAFEEAGAEIVAVNAAGCGAMMKDYAALLEDDPAFAERAKNFVTRVRDVSELLAQLGPRTGAPLPLRVTYDAPCHLHHAQRITRAPLQVLAAIPGLEHVPLRNADECCGGAGIYGLMHPDLGGRILADKLEAIRETKADVVATPNPGCAMQIGAGLVLCGSDTPVVHPIELLNESYRRLREVT
jgi:glycolate oxidase iron-sulfur subunit